MAISTGSDIVASDFVSTSSGAADSGKVAKLNASGKIPNDFIEYNSDVQEFSTAGANTWTKPSMGTLALVELWAAGGSGAAAKDTTAPYAVAATGGGGGEYVSFLIPLILLGATETVTIGAGGAAQTLSVQSTANGVAGGDTTFGSLGTAKGGNGGTAATVGGAVSGGTGGTGGTTPMFEVKKDAGAAGGSAETDTPNYANNGSSNDFGGGGGGAASVYSPAAFSGAGTGGASTEGGDGGDGGYNANGTAGASKGGGGGAHVSDNATTYSSGKGGEGFARITVF